MKTFELSSNSAKARAKILEIPDQGFGQKEIGSEYLKTGQSDWLSWASAMGDSNAIESSGANSAANPAVEQRLLMESNA